MRETLSRLLVVRHGESTWNAAGRWQGQADPPLSELGEAQARSAARRAISVDAVWSSDLQRSYRTARTIADAWALVVVPDARVRERAAGRWTGLTRAEIDARFPGDLATGGRPPGFEADDDLAARVIAALRDFAAALAGGTGLVVTHGGVILVLERRYGTAPAPLANLEGRWVHVGDSEIVLGERQLLLDPADVAVTTPRQL